MLPGALRPEANFKQLSKGGRAPRGDKADLLNSMPLQIIGGTQQRHIETRAWGA